jgi:hypothetical protein
VVSCPNYPSLQNYAVLDSPKTTSFCPKQRSFRHFRFYFYFYFIFLKKRRKLKKKKKKKKKKEIGVAGATPCPKNGVAGNRGGFGHPILAVWGWPKPPQAFGGGPATPKGHQEKKKKTEKWVWDFGGGRTTPKGLGVASATPYGRGWPKPPPGPWGWSGHPKNPKPIFPFFFFFGLSGWPDHPQRPGGGFGHHLPVVGGGRPPLGQKWGG